MDKYLAALIWPVGIVIIAAVGFILIRRAPANDGPALVAPAPGHRHKAHDNNQGLLDLGWESVRLGAITVVGAIVVYGLMCALGLIVVHHGLTIDRPIFNWMQKPGHSVHALAAVMKRLTKIGDTWTTWGAAAAAAACLAVTWRSKRWLPPVTFAAAIVIDHFTTLALRHTFHRLGPPTSPLGTYPSGGCDRVILFYGLIAYLLWREFSGQRRTAIAFGTVVAALGFNEAFSRVYLSLHWTTDALSGLLYGCLLLAVFITAVRLVAGRSPLPKAPAGAATGAQEPLATGPSR